MEVGVRPPLPFSVPPGVFIVERHSQPPLERLVQSSVAPAFVPPTEQLDQLVSTEADLPIHEAGRFADLHQPEDHFVVNCRWKTKFVRGRNSQPANAVLPLATIPNTIFVHQGLAAPRSTIRQCGKRKLGEVHFVLPHVVQMRLGQRGFRCRAATFHFPPFKRQQQAGAGCCHFYLVE